MASPAAAVRPPLGACRAPRTSLRCLAASRPRVATALREVAVVSGALRLQQGLSPAPAPLGRPHDTAAAAPPPPPAWPPLVAWPPEARHLAAAFKWAFQSFSVKLVSALTLVIVAEAVGALAPVDATEMMGGHGAGAQGQLPLELLCSVLGNDECSDMSATSDPARATTVTAQAAAAAAAAAGSAPPVSATAGAAPPRAMLQQASSLAPRRCQLSPYGGRKGLQLFAGEDAMQAEAAARAPKQSAGKVWPKSFATCVIGTPREGGRLMG